MTSGNENRGCFSLSPSSCEVLLEGSCGSIAVPSSRNRTAAAALPRDMWRQTLRPALQNSMGFESRRDVNCVADETARQPHNPHSTWPITFWQQIQPTSRTENAITHLVVSSARFLGGKRLIRTSLSQISAQPSWAYPLQFGFQLVHTRASFACGLPAFTF